MGIYIKGMKMPTSCGYCPLKYRTMEGDECMFNARSTEYQKRPDDCPLVHVPPHGDLIDRDALPLENQGLMLTDPDEWGLKVSDIENAPTIIPASKEGE